MTEEFSEMYKRRDDLFDSLTAYRSLILDCVDEMGQIKDLIAGLEFHGSMMVEKFQANAGDQRGFDVEAFMVMVGYTNIKIWLAEWYMEKQSAE